MKIHNHLPSPVSFREDINGLRAWAVMAVLFFHFSLIGLPGGFVGVDVFFVISGYLMTAIIVSGHEKGNFSVWKFYMARARRILPALMIVITALLVLGWFWLPTPDYQALGAQSVYSLTFLSNIHYWLSAGYFDAAAQEKWLLHTWSLAVEAQFYLLYPLFVALMWRFWPGLKALTIGLSVLFMASLALNLVVSFWKPTVAFYLLPTRGWELAAGGLVYLIARQRWASEAVRSKSFWMGWLLVIASFALIDESMAWPGYWSILPVMGASLIIFGHREDCFLTNNAVAQWLGDRSYSLYLWHWPLVVALYFAGLQSEWSWVLGFLALSLLLAQLSYHYIEVPTRSYLSAASLRKEIFAIGVAGAMIGIAAVSVKVISFESRAANQTEQAQYVIKYSRENYIPVIRKAYKDECNFFDDQFRYAAKKEGIAVSSCLSDSSESVFLWGDSHAQALSYGLRSVLAEKFINVSFSQVASSGCRPHLSEDVQTSGEFKKACDRSNNFAYDAVKNIKPKVVVLAQRDRHTLNNLIEIANELLQVGVQKVFILGPLPQWSNDLPRIIARNHWLNDDKKIDSEMFLTDMLDIDKNLRESIEQNGNKDIVFLSPLANLCESSSNCLAILDGHKTPLAFDYGHLTKEGSVLVAEKILTPALSEVFESK